MYQPGWALHSLNTGLKMSWCQERRREGGKVLLRVGRGAPTCFYKQRLRSAALTLRPVSHQVLIHKYNYLENIKVIIQRIYLLLNLYCSKNTERNG